MTVFLLVIQGIVFSDIKKKKKSITVLLNLYVVPLTALDLSLSYTLLLVFLLNKDLQQSLISYAHMWTGWFVDCFTSQQHVSVSQGRICSDTFMCCHTEIEVADQTFHLT